MPKKTTEEKIMAAQKRVAMLKHNRRKEDTREKIIYGAWWIRLLRENAKLRKFALDDLVRNPLRPQDMDVLADSLEELRKLPLPE